MLAKALVPIWLISWAILLPVDGVGNNEALDALDRFTFGNVSKKHQARYWAHLILVYVFNGMLWWHVEAASLSYADARMVHVPYSL